MLYRFLAMRRAIAAAGHQRVANVCRHSLYCAIDAFNQLSIQVSRVDVQAAEMWLDACLPSGAKVNTGAPLRIIGAAAVPVSPTGLRSVSVCILIAAVCA